MTTILFCLAAVLLSTAVLVVILLRSGAVAVEADDTRPDPVDAVHDEYERSSYFVDGGHPKDCAEKCCWEIRLTELHDAFDWHAAEYDLRTKRATPP